MRIGRLSITYLGSQPWFGKAYYTKSLCKCTIAYMGRITVEWLSNYCLLKERESERYEQKSKSTN